MDIRAWSGNIEELVTHANKRLERIGKSASSTQGPLTIRVIRDYIQRGLLGEIERSGKESVFYYENLTRLLATRILLSDGWPLAKIREHLDLSSLASIESIIPQYENEAVRSVKRIWGEIKQKIPEPTAELISDSIAKVSAFKVELSAQSKKQGEGREHPMPEQWTRIKPNYWCQVLVRSDRVSRATIIEAEEIGRAVTASIIAIASEKRK